MVWTWIDSKELKAFASEILEGVEDDDWNGGKEQRERHSLSIGYYLKLKLKTTNIKIYTRSS